MSERKDMGEIPSEGEFVPATRTGKKAVVIMTVKVMVEVEESDDWNDMTEQAKNSLNGRIIEGKGFYPFSAKTDTIHTNLNVLDLKYRTFVDEKSRW